MSASAVVDSNILLSATDPSRTDHEAALTLLTRDPRDLVITPQVLREYLAVSTRAVDANGLGLDPSTAVANAEAVSSSLRLVPEDANTAVRLLVLVQDGRAAGRQVHDANIVATALAHGASTIITSDTRHFARFADLIEVESLS